MNALAHYLAVGRRDGRELGKRPLSLADVVAPTAVGKMLQRAGVVDIVLPVYRGLDETRNCIESVLASQNRTRTRLHIYNDCSPEPRSPPTCASWPATSRRCVWSRIRRISASC